MYFEETKSVRLKLDWKQFSKQLGSFLKRGSVMSLTVFNQTEFEYLTSARDTVFGNVLFDKLF